MEDEHAQVSSAFVNCEFLRTEIPGTTTYHRPIREALQHSWWHYVWPPLLSSTRKCRDIDIFLKLNSHLLECDISISRLMLEWLIWLTLVLVLFCVKLNSQIWLRFRLRPDLSSQIRPDPAPAGFGKVKSGTSLIKSVSATSYQWPIATLVLACIFSEIYGDLNGDYHHIFYNPAHLMHWLG